MKHLILKQAVLSLFMDYKTNVPLAPYTTVQIGGPAEFFITATGSDHLRAILDDLALKQAQNITILGNGSNTLISDSGLSGYVIKNNSNHIEILQNNQIKVDSGVQLPYLIDFSLKNGLTGLETFAYIPSTVGGAIAGNIHGTEFHFKDITKSIKYYSDQNPIILSAILQLKKGNATDALKIKDEIIQKKSLNQPMNSLGCIFKNPSSQSTAGMIIDQQLGLKGFRIGDAAISEKHANFIVNLGHATAKDYYSVICHIKKLALEKLNLNLDLEIKLLGQI